MTVERVDPRPSSPWWGEHRSRYRFAAAYVHGKRVVDAACGTGYGSMMLDAAGATAVIAVDNDPTAIATIRDRGGSSIVTLKADVRRLPLEAGSVDVVTSFETLEHIADPELFVSEIRRILSPDGVALISTPNRLHTEALGRPANQYHLQEYAPSELRAILSQTFGRLEVLGQRVHPGTALTRIGNHRSPFRTI